MQSTGNLDKRVELETEIERAMQDSRLARLLIGDFWGTVRFKGGCTVCVCVAATNDIFDQPMTPATWPDLNRNVKAPIASIFNVGAHMFTIVALSVASKPFAGARVEPSVRDDRGAAGHIWSWWAVGLLVFVRGVGGVWYSPA